MKNIKRRNALIIAAVLATVLGAAYIAAGLDGRLQVTEYAVSSAKFDKNICIVLITDLHSCRYGSTQAELINAVAAARPDLVLLGGDICDDQIPDTNTELLLKGIAGHFPCYYVTGNHEYWSRRVDSMLALFRRYGVTVLEGQMVTVSIRGCSINLCGITDPDVINYTDSKRSAAQQLAELKSMSKKGLYTILLAHRPELIGQYSSCGFDLVLAGHAHGGQWRLPGGGGTGLYAPNQGFFPRWAGGEYAVGSTRMIVSRGLARESTRIPRLYNRPELVVVELRPE